MSSGARARRPWAALSAALVSAIAALACVEEVTIGGDTSDAAPHDAGADSRPNDVATPPPPPPPPLDAEAGCPTGEVLQMGVCVPITPPPPCSLTQLDGSCPGLQTCEMGQCLKPPADCSPKAPAGACPAGTTCEMGACVPAAPCSTMGADADTCAAGQICSPTGSCQVDPCAVSMCADLCCPVWLMGAFVPECTMGMSCP